MYIIEKISDEKFQTLSNGEVVHIYPKLGLCMDKFGVLLKIGDYEIPCSSFDLTDEKQQKVCFHYTNLQPLTVEENAKKGNKLVY